MSGKHLVWPGVVALVPTAAIVVLVSAAGTPTSAPGAPDGAHFTVVLTGVATGVVPNPDQRPRIFVPLQGRSRIELTQAGAASVRDSNGRDGPAELALPVPGTDSDGVTGLSGYLRAAGRSNGKAVLQSCYADRSGTWCAGDVAGGVEPVSLRPSSGKARFKNLSRNLFYVDRCVSWDSTSRACTKAARQPIFHDTSARYFWQYDDDGLRLAQLRLYDAKRPTAPPERGKATRQPEQRPAATRHPASRPPKRPVTVCVTRLVKG